MAVHPDRDMRIAKIIDFFILILIIGRLEDFTEYNYYCPNGGYDSRYIHKRTSI
jgi:hypothetical protein